jgi:hypothetical protein
LPQTPNGHSLFNIYLAASYAMCCIVYWFSTFNR